MVPLNSLGMGEIIYSATRVRKLIYLEIVYLGSLTVEMGVTAIWIWSGPEAFWDSQKAPQIYHFLYLRRYMDTS